MSISVLTVGKLTAQYYSDIYWQKIRRYQKKITNLKKSRIHRTWIPLCIRRISDRSSIGKPPTDWHAYNQINPRQTSVRWNTIGSPSAGDRKYPVLRDGCLYYVYNSAAYQLGFEIENISHALIICVGICGFGIENGGGNFKSVRNVTILEAWVYALQHRHVKWLGIWVGGEPSEWLLANRLYIQQLKLSIVANL